MIPPSKACGLADVELAGHYIGDQAGAVFLEKVDLAAGTRDGGSDGSCTLLDVLDDGGLFRKKALHLSWWVGSIGS